ncbi:ribosomal RNA small subunit methyltransferase NEP1-like [Styela clava]|uniref:ribosomal RNA small subunit methyltransferase NEP1-like n=1 Tax=Styela clava TaxID=7725 RepID=UPI001939727F|nr:ribosomal RNA small subunit methyltransferase NEP1-like [Styela clava]
MDKPGSKRPSDTEATSVVAKIARPFGKDGQSKRLIVVLEKASLETVKNGKTFELLNCDKHKGLLKKHNRDLGSCRPDITHQCLMMLMDSPLNRAGLLQVYIHTTNNILIEVHPQTRIPRTFDRFCGLMVQLLHKLSVRAADANLKLMKVIKNPVTDYFPPGCKRMCMSFGATDVVHPKTLAPPNEAVACVIGAMAHGSVDVDYTEKSYSISNYPLSAALTCTKLCSGFEEKWGII